MSDSLSSTSASSASSASSVTMSPPSPAPSYASSSPSSPPSPEPPARAPPAATVGPPAAIELATGRLYFAVLLGVPPAVAGGEDAHFFSVDDDFAYWPFFLDYGPLSLSSLFRFSTQLSGLLREHPAPRRIYMYSLAGEAHEAKRANAVYLLAAYLMLCHERSPEEAW